MRGLVSIQPRYAIHSRRKAGSHRPDAGFSPVVVFDEDSTINHYEDPDAGEVIEGVPVERDYQRMLHLVRQRAIRELWLALGRRAGKDSAASALIAYLATYGEFARHLQTLDPACEIPPANLLPFRPRRAIPHLYQPHAEPGEIAAQRARKATTTSHE